MQYIYIYVLEQENEVNISSDNEEAVNCEKNGQINGNDSNPLIIRELRIVLTRLKRKHCGNDSETSPVRQPLASIENTISRKVNKLKIK